MSKPPKEFLNPDTLSPPGPAGYSHVAKINKGTIVYLSGQVPIDASGKLVGEGNFEAQVGILRGCSIHSLRADAVRRCR